MHGPLPPLRRACRYMQRLWPHGRRPSRLANQFRPRHLPDVTFAGIIGLPHIAAPIEHDLSQPGSQFRFGGSLETGKPSLSMEVGFLHQIRSADLIAKLAV